MRQYESCIQIIIIIIKKKDIINLDGQRECEERERDLFFFIFLSLLSKI